MHAQFANYCCYGETVQLKEVGQAGALLAKAYFGTKAAMVIILVSTFIKIFPGWGIFFFGTSLGTERSEVTKSC